MGFKGILELNYIAIITENGQKEGNCTITIKSIILLIVFPSICKNK